jgi:hypothetical protein
MRLTQINKNQKAEQFIKYMDENYPRNFLNERQHVIDNKALVSLSIDKWTGADIMIDDLASIEKGGGNYAMTILCNIADEIGVSFSVTAHPLESFAGKKMTLEELVNWYKSFGFVLSDDYTDEKGIDNFEGYDNIDMIRKV